MVKLKKLNTKKLQDQAFDQITDRIMSGMWKPGDKLPSENELAAMMGISRISVRETMQKLTAMDLVETHRGKGSFVKEFTTNSYLKSLAPMVSLSRQDLLDIIQYRRILETGVVDLFMAHWNQDDIVVLKDIHQHMQSSTKDLANFIEHDLNFHMKLFEMTKNDFIIKVSTMVSDIFGSAMAGFVTETGAEEGVEAHRKIIEAIEHDDPATIKTIISGVFDAIEQAIREAPG